MPINLKLSFHGKGLKSIECISEEKNELSLSLDPYTDFYGFFYTI